MGDPGPHEGVVNSPEDGVKAVRERYKEGADVIKITATGGVLSVAKNGKNPQFSIEEIKAITTTAKDYNMLTAAHAHGDEGIWKRTSILRIARLLYCYRFFIRGATQCEVRAPSKHSLHHQTWSDLLTRCARTVDNTDIHLVCLLVTNLWNNSADNVDLCQLICTDSWKSDGNLFVDLHGRHPIWFAADWLSHRSHWRPPDNRFLWRNIIARRISNLVDF